MEYREDNFSFKGRKFIVKKVPEFANFIKYLFFIVILLKSLYFAENISSNSSEIYLNIFSIIFIISPTVLMRPKKLL